MSPTQAARPKGRSQKPKVSQAPAADFNAWNQVADQSGWSKVEDSTSYLDPKNVEQQGRVDGLGALIPFWIEGVHAAERGEEVMKMEQFYDELDAHNTTSWDWGEEKKRSDGWGSGCNDWGVSGDTGGWDAPVDTGGWDAPPDPTGWGAPGGWDQQPSGWGNDGWNSQEAAKGYASDDTERQEHGRRKVEDVETLVSKYAHDAGPERRRQMYDFLQVCETKCFCEYLLILVQMPTEGKVQKIQEMIYHM